MVKTVKQVCSSSLLLLDYGTEELIAYTLFKIKGAFFFRKKEIEDSKTQGFRYLIPAVDIEYVLSNKTNPLSPLHGK